MRVIYLRLVCGKKTMNALSKIQRYCKNYGIQLKTKTR